MQLGVGAVVQHEGRDFLVTRSRPLGLAGPWQQLIGLQGDTGPALLLIGAVGVAERCWLLAESERLGKLLDGGESLQAPYNPPEFVQDGGLRYRLSARYLATQTIEHGSSEAVRLSCYQGPGAQRLLLLKTAGPARGQLFVGQVVSADSLLLLPTASAGAKGAGD